MTPRNQITENQSLLERLLSKYKQEQWHTPTLCHRTVSRRGFLTAGVIGAVGLSLSPLEKALAAYNLTPHFIEPEPRILASPFIDFVLGIGRAVAYAFGFGPWFDTAYGIISYLLSDKSKQTQTDASKGVANADAEIAAHKNDYGVNDLISLAKRIFSAPGKPLQNVFAAVVPKSTSLERVNSGLTLAHALPPPNDKRYYAMAVGGSSINSLIPIFDYNDGKYDTKALVGLPTFKTYQGILNDARLKGLYGGIEQIRPLIFPQGQKDTEKAYGVWEQNYKKQDRYDTAAGTTLEFFYEFKGEFKGNNPKPGEVYGELTTKLGGFRCPERWKKMPPCTIKDIYRWVPQKTAPVLT